MVCLEFRFLCVLGGRQTPKTVLQGWMEYATPALQVVIMKAIYWGTQERWQPILGFALASIVTLGGVGGLVAVR